MFRVSAIACSSATDFLFSSAISTCVVAPCYGGRNPPGGGGAGRCWKWYLGILRIARELFLATPEPQSRAPPAPRPPLAGLGHPLLARPRRCCSCCSPP